MISYAQNLEDVLLSRAFRGRQEGFYIDVGAWHPVTDSVTKYFYDLGWHGINVEPVEDYVRVLEEQRPRDLNLCIALGERPESLLLHRFPDSGLSTLRGDFLPGYRQLGLESEAVACEVSTLAGLCDSHVREEIDFLKIDTEGWEGQVIRGGDWRRHRPRIVIVEAVLPNPEMFLHPGGAGASGPPAWDEWEGFLCSFDYELCYFDGLNRFYVRREDRDLRTAFDVPPNVFDQYVPWQQLELMNRINELGAEVEELTRERDRLRVELEGKQG